MLTKKQLLDRMDNILNTAEHIIDKSVYNNLAIQYGDYREVIGEYLAYGKMFMYIQETSYKNNEEISKRHKRFNEISDKADEMFRLLRNNP